MGLGGQLLWSSVVRTLNEESRQRVRVCYAPLITDLLAGRLYAGDVWLADDPVLRGNPRVEFPPRVEKPRWARWIDRRAAGALRQTGLMRAYESLVFRLSTLRTRSTGQFDVHLDLQLHSYAARELPDRMIWKSGGHIIDIILAAYGAKARDHRCEIYFSPEEEREADDLCRRYGIGREFVVIEPNSKADWFGDLRAWPIERWQDVVDRVKADGRYQVVQVGEGGGHELKHAINLSGLISVRLAICIMKRAKLFLGLEGGLMHAANAVGVAAVIVWGGLTLPEFAGYREMHTILCTYVECAPCGLRGGCPYGKKCLTSVHTDEVLGAMDALTRAESARPGASTA